MRLISSIVKKLIIPAACVVAIAVAVVPASVLAEDVQSVEVTLDTEGAVDDYNFVVIEDESVPLAAAPAPVNHTGRVIWVVCLSILAVFAVFYASTIIIYNNRVKAIEPLMTDEDIREIKQPSIMFNPLRHNDVLAAKESDLATR